MQERLFTSVPLTSVSLTLTSSVDSTLQQVEAENQHPAEQQVPGMFATQAISSKLDLCITVCGAGLMFLRQ